MSQRNLIVATKNPHKIEEIAKILGPKTRVRPATAVAENISWEETGSSFEANARIKIAALAYHVDQGTGILADDSGLAVDALSGAPGIYSSRFSGTEGDCAANNAKLLAELASVPDEDRTARFVCVLVYRNQHGEEHMFRGECTGKIAREPRGLNGFGYDPLFIPDGYTQTMAELSSDVKNKISHRSRAIEQWVAAMT